MTPLFTVTEPDGSKPDLRQIALTESWAKGLMYCDMDDFSLMPDGTLLLLDECGKYAACPEGRFRVEWNEMPKVRR